MYIDIVNQNTYRLYPYKCLYNNQMYKYINYLHQFE